VRVLVSARFFFQVGWDFVKRVRDFSRADFYLKEGRGAFFRSLHFDLQLRQDWLACVRSILACFSFSSAAFFNSISCF
jgi:hypothetical protein